jgi:hypothetical protein
MLLILSAILFTAVDEDALKAFEMISRHKVAMVSTVSLEKENTVHKPYSSVMGIALESGIPFVFISDLAIHTDNIKINPHVSIMVFEPSEDNVFNSPRVTFDGKLLKVTDKKRIKKLRKLYLAKHKKAKEFIDLKDFNFYVLKIESIYFVGGFGDESYIGYLDVNDYKKAASEIKKK